jgi:hypothetical protein
MGNPAFANYVIAQDPSQGTNYRVIHLWDPVPSEPSQSSGYAHILPAYYISSGNNVTVTPADITIQTTDIDPPSAPTSEDGDNAHDWYFNRTPDCYPSPCEICIPYNKMFGGTGR